MIALSRLGFLLVYNLCFGLNVTRTLLLVVIIAMNDAIGTTCCQRATPALDATRRSRKAARSSRSFALALVFAFALRLQWVDGRRVDAFVAYLHCSRVQRGAAPTVSNVSA